MARSLEDLQGVGYGSFERVINKGFIWFGRDHVEVCEEDIWLKYLVVSRKELKCVLSGIKDSVREVMRRRRWYLLLDKRVSYRR